jgi:ATP-dependent Zn protease
MKRRAVRWTPRPRRHPGRKALAYHEAGHAVVGYSLGLTIECVTIIPNETSLGHCRYRDWEGWASACDPDTLLSVLLAGAVAEEIATGRPSGGSDDRKALGVARTHTAGDRHAATRVAVARSRTARVLEEHWPAVKAMAVALRKFRELEGAEAMLALARAFRRLENERGRVPAAPKA